MKAVPADRLWDVVGLAIVALVALFNPAHLLHHAIVYNDAYIIARKHNVARSDWTQETDAKHKNSSLDVHMFVLNTHM